MVVLYLNWRELLKTRSAVFFQSFSAVKETGILDGLTWHLNILPRDIRSKGEGISEQSFVLGQRATYQDIT